MHALKITFWLISVASWAMVTHLAFCRLEAEDPFLAFDVLIACGYFTLFIAQELCKAIAEALE